MDPFTKAMMQAVQGPPRSAANKPRTPLPMPKTGDDPEFDKWKARHAPNDSGYDYDHYQMFKDLKGAAPEKAANGHGTDRYKKPNHPTFSDQSIYSSADTPGGVWSKDPDGQDAYTPSQWMRKDPARVAELKKYMAEREKNVRLRLD